ncbi:MAG: DMT family transporter [Gaiellaceae bacterium]
MTAIALASASAFLFGAMTVLIRLALRTGISPEAGTALTVLPALGVTALVTAGRGEWDVASAWPFLLAGLLAPGLSQILFTFGVRDAGASRSSVTVGTAPLFAVAIALVFLDEPLVAGLVVGAALIVAGGILLASERRRPEHFRRVGLLFALGATVAFATRDSLVRWLGTEATDVDAGLAAFATMLTGALVTVAFALAARVTWTRRGAVAFLPAGLCYGLSYVLLFEAFYRGRVSVVSPIVATESLWGVALSALVLGRSERIGPRLVVGAALVAAGGILIGIYR